MEIILNEKDYIAELINKRELGKKPHITLCQIARYYRQVDGFSKKETKAKLETFILQCDPGASLVSWSNTIEYAVKTAMKYKLTEISGVDITEEEMKVCESLEGVQRQRIAFTLLCMAKYWNAVNPKNDNWVNAQDKDVMNCAGAKTTSKRYCQFLYEMGNADLIGFSKKIDNLNIKVNYVHNESPVVYRVTDFRNIGNQYMMLHGGGYMQCKQCGLVIRRKNNRQEYCDSCSSQRYIKKSVESVMRHRLGINDKN